MDLPEIHVLAFNNAGYTAQTLKGLRQTSPGHPVTVIDNGSNEEAFEILTNFAVQERVISLPISDLPREAHVARGKNWSLDNGESEWLLLLDNDVLLVTGWWEMMQQHITAFPEVGLWVFYPCSNHRTVRTEERFGISIRIPSLVSGAALLLRPTDCKRFGIRWPDEPQDYSDHPYWKDMGGFTDTDVRFGMLFEEAGMWVAWPEIDMAIHLWQPGREGRAYV